MAGPLSVKMQNEKEKAILDGQQKIIKLLNDQRRAEEMHKLKVAEKVELAKQKGADISSAVPKGKAPVAPLGKPSNPEAGPSDTIPAMLSPGEAVIPAPAAQLPENKGIIKSLVEQGRALAEGVIPALTGNSGGLGKAKEALSGRDRVIDSAAGYQSGTTNVELPPMGKIEKRSIWEALTKKKEPKKEAHSGGMLGSAKSALANRGKQLEEKEKEALGYQAGTTAVPFLEGVNSPLTEKEVMMRESGGNPTARNPNSSATGLYQMIGRARKDVESRRPDLRGSDFNNPMVQAQYRDTYKGILSERLSSRGIEPNDDLINKAWVVGDEGLAKIMANPGKTLDEVLGSKVTSINPNLKGKTVEEFLSDKDPYTRKKVTADTNAPDQSAAETARLAAPPIPRSTNGFGAISGAGTVMQMQNLMQITDNPKASPESRADANKRIKELVPVIQGNFSDARFEASRPTVPPKAPDGFVPPKPTSVPPKAAVGPDEDAMRLPASVASKAEVIDRTLSDPVVMQQLSELQKTPPPEGKDPKNWLAEGLSKIFGPTGMFNGDDLIRFSILAAGGMLTGGSVGGSLRFAGLSTIKQSDERKQLEAVAKAKTAEQMRAYQVEQAKDVRERNQSLENTFYQKMDKASPESKAEAQKLFDESRTAKTPGEREAKLTQAIRLMAANQVDTSKDGKPRAPVGGYNARTGEPLEYFWADDNRKMVIDPKTGNFIDAAKAGLVVLPESDFRATERLQRDSISKRLTDRLSDLNRRADGSQLDKTFTDSAAKSKAEALTEEFMSLRRDMGFDMKPGDFSKVVDNTIANISESYRGRKINDLSPEALRRIVYGSAVISMRPSNKPLYTVPNKDGKAGRPGEEALSNFGNAIQRAIEEAKGQGVQLTPDKVAAKLEEQYKALPDKMKEKYEIQSRAEKGYSPYLLWVKGFTANR